MQRHLLVTTAILTLLNFSLLISPKAQEEKKEAATEKSSNTAKKAKPPIETSQNLEVVYGSSPWNVDSTKIDNAELFVRDASSGRVLKILLEETEPDSSTFSGNFSVGFSKEGDLNPEVYIPPENIRGKNKALNQFTTKIRSGKVGRKPIVLKRGKNNEQILDVYDTKEQAQQAFNAYKEKIKQEEAQKSLIEPATNVVKKADAEAAALAVKQARLAELAAQAAAREEDRIRQEQLERQRALERKRKMEELAEREKQKRRDQARALAEKAIAAYKQGDFLTAEKLFRESVEMDPTETSYYFRYGVSLYRNEKFNEALVILNIAEVDEITNIEKTYYLGLIHFRLKELDKSLEKFNFVKQTQHEIMAPSAGFYEGVILYTKEDYEKAKGSFEFVLDTSKDPRLDEKAEEYLEKIANAMIFKKKQEQKHDLMITVGANYDSNVLFSPDNQTSTETDKGGFRLLEAVNYTYRATYLRDFDWSLNLNQLYLYSLNSDLQVADPMVVSLKSPVNWKGVMSGKGFKLSANPGYELLYMDTTEGEGKNPPSTNLLKSILFDIDFTLIMSENWFSNYKLENRIDDSLDDDSEGAADADEDENSDATLMAFKTTQTLFLDKTKKRAVQAGGGYTLNNAEGKNKKYDKIQLSFSYSQPFKNWKDALWNGGITYYVIDYSESTDNRKDTNYALNLAFTKKQNSWFSWGTTINYTTNNSDTNQYTKQSLLATASFDIDEWVNKDKP